MKLKLKSVSLLVLLFVMLPILTGCPDSNKGVAFFEYEPESREINISDGNGTLFMGYKFADDISREYYYKKQLVDENNDASHIDTTAGNKSGCDNVVDGKIYFQTKFYATKPKKIKLHITIYEDSQCKKKVEDYYSGEFKLVEENTINSTVQNVINKIGGETQYCNIDSNGNYRMVYGVPEFVQIAYSQMTYGINIYNEDLNNCKRPSTGIAVDYTKTMYSKYGSSGNLGQISMNFLNWVAKKAKINLGSSGSVVELVNWAKKKERYSEGFTTANVGDIVVLEDVFIKNKNPQKVSDPRGVGIIYEKSSNTYNYITVSGNDSDYVCRVSGRYIESGYTSDSRVIGVINMKGLAY